jgi:hypothetical protein
MFTTLLAPRILAPLLAVLVLSTGAPPARATPPQNRRAVELTYLKSAPGQREPLKQFIVRNWFAMDRIAVQQGLMRSFTVMDTGTDDGPWNVLVTVTYTDARGYDGIAEAFETIRRAHTPVLVDGKTLRDLGAIVESKRVYEDIAEAHYP